MDARESYIGLIKLAEHQFRLACTVHLAVINEAQTLDVPVEWKFGTHQVSYRDFGLRRDQAPLAASLLEETAMFALASVIRDALVNVFPNTKNNPNPNVVSCYQISRLIRNAFAHSMIDPVWSIDKDCLNKVFSIEGIISIDTHTLNGKRIVWPDYGGPLAIFHFGRFVREVILESPVDPKRQEPDFPTIASYQQGRMVFRKIDRLPDGLVEVARAGPGEDIDLGDGYRLVNLGKGESE